MAGNIIELHAEVPANQEGNVFGQFDEHLKLIERTLNVTMISRDGTLKILERGPGETTHRRACGTGKQRQHHYQAKRQLRPFLGHGRKKPGIDGNR